MLPPTFAWGNRVANAPPNLSFPGFMNINRTQDVSISLTKVTGRHTIKAGFYLNHSYKAQNLGAGGGASFQGAISFANDTATRSTPASASPMPRSACSRRYQQQSKFVEGSYIYNKVDWYVQDNWKVNPQADARLRAAVRATSSRSTISTCRPRTSSPSSGRRRRAPPLVRAGLRRRRQPLLGHQPPGDESRRRAAARAEHVAGDRPARAEHGQRAERHRQGRRRHREGQLRVADARARAARSASPTTSPARSGSSCAAASGCSSIARTATRCSRRSATRRSRPRRRCATRSCRASTSAA